MSLDEDLAALQDFLGSCTPEAWLDAALADLPLLLVDHAHCEKKAAAAALGLIHAHPERDALVQRMSRLAREELRHMEQVLRICRARGISFREIGPARYAAELHALVRSHAGGDSDARLADKLIVGAFIEARSCERFAALVPRLETAGEVELARFYGGLLAAEARHFQHYLGLAEELLAGSGSADALDARVALFRAREQALIAEPDELLRFHSGPPAT